MTLAQGLQLLGRRSRENSGVRETAQHKAGRKPIAPRARLPANWTSQCQAELNLISVDAIHALIQVSKLIGHTWIDFDDPKRVVIHIMKHLDVEHRVIQPGAPDQ